MADIFEEFDKPEDTFEGFDKPEDQFAEFDKPEDQFAEFDMPEEMSQTEAAKLGALQGVSFGFSDEIGAFLETGEVSGESYDKAVKERRDELKEAQEDWGKTYIASEIGGGIVSGFFLPLGAAGKAATVGKAAMKAGAIGAIEGAVGGYGIAEGSAEEQAVMAGMGAMIGAGAGGAFGALFNGAPKLWNKFKDPKKMNDVEKTSARNMIRTTDEIALQDDAINKQTLGSIQKVDEAGNERLLIDEDIVTGRALQVSPDSGDSAKMKLDDIFGEDGAIEYVNKVKGKDLAGYEEARESLEPFYVIQTAEDTEELLKRAEREWAAVDKPAEYNKVADEILAKLPNPEESRKLAKDYNYDVNPAEVDSTVRSIEELSNSMGFPTSVSGNEDYIKAFYVYRNDMIRYMESIVGDIKGKPSAKKSKNIYDNTRTVAEVNPNYLKELTIEFNKQVKQGRATAESWNSYKYGQYLSEAVKKENQKAADELTHRSLPRDVMQEKELLEEYNKQNLLKANDPMDTRYSKLMDMQYVAQLSDDVTGLDTANIIRETQSAAIRKNSMNKYFIDKRLAARALADKENLTSEQISRNILKGKITETERAYKDIFEEMRTELNKHGAMIDKDPKYIPMKKKRGPELILAFENKYKELGIDDLVENETIANLVKRAKEVDGTMDEGLEGGLDDIMADITDNDHQGLVELIYFVKKHLNRDIVSLGDLQQIFRSKELRTPISLRRSTNPEISMAFKRKGNLPGWIREYNIDKLLHNYMDTASTLIHLEPATRKMDQRLPVLRQMGQSRTAELMHNWRTDLIGGYRDNWVNKGNISRMKYELWAADKGPYAQAAPEFLDVMASSIYPNLIGASPKAVIRNLHQPMTMTVPEMGWWYGTKRAIGAYKKLITGGYKRAMQELDHYDLRMKTLDPSSFEGFKNGITEGTSKFKTTRKVINAYTSAVMSAFGKSDEINRYITLQMSKDFADDILTGNLGKGTALAYKRLPSGVKAKIGSLLDGKIPGADVRDEVTKLLGQYYVSKTQLIYGKVAMHEFGRDLGPALTMMTKWQVAITSEIYYGIQKKDFSRVASKFVGPLVAASILSGMMLDTDEVRTRALVGSGGFVDYLPINSLFAATDILVPLNIATGLTAGYEGQKAVTTALSGNWGVEDTRDIKKVSKRLVQQYVPIGGSAWRIYDTWYKKLWLGEKP